MIKTKAYGLLIFTLFILSACANTPAKHAPPAFAAANNSNESSVGPQPPRSPASDDSISQWQRQQQSSYFDWPVDEARMTRGYLPNRKKPHLGLDLAARKGSAIYASHDGTVIYTGREFHGYGRLIMIEGQQGWASLYAHLSKINIKQGDRVKKGDLIGLMGSTGHSTGVHLHFEIRTSAGPVDPLMYLPTGKSAQK